MSSSLRSNANEPLTHSDRAEAILTFWFGASKPKTVGQYRKEWFVKSNDFDQQIRQHFLVDIEKAAQGDYDHWQQQARYAVALLILLDQFPRNIYRGSAKSFETDHKAIEVATKLVETEMDQTLPPVYQFFIYVPFEHQETLAQQNRAVALMTQLVKRHPNIDQGLKSGLDFAIRHRDVIERFGRFPHRNEILGRQSTAEEKAFLTQPGSRF
ncbi:MAG: DUF924 family protein [Phormidesmis sp.]